MTSFTQSRSLRFRRRKRFERVSTACYKADYGPHKGFIPSRRTKNAP